MNTHICLLNHELIPNVIGALHDGAHRVVPVGASSVHSRVAPFQAAFEAAGSLTVMGAPVDVIPFDLDDCLHTLRGVAREHPRAMFNWTGGTKVMSFAARRVAEECQARALYVRPNCRELLIEDLAAGTSRVDVTDATRLGLNLLAHLRAVGHTVEGADSPADFAARYTPNPDLVVAAVALIDANPSERGDIFHLAAADKIPFAPRRLNSGFLYILQRASLIEPAVHSGEFYLSSVTIQPRFHLESPQDTNARFLRASYLEAFLWSQIRDRCGLGEVAWGVRLNPGEQGRMAEIDVAVSGEGRLLIVEAKTGVELLRLADVIEEQAARCRRLGGPSARWMLYVHKFRAEHLGPEAVAVIAAQEARAEDYGGRLVWHDDLNELPSIVSGLIDEPLSEG